MTPALQWFQLNFGARIFAAGDRVRVYCACSCVWPRLTPGASGRGTGSPRSLRGAVRWETLETWLTEVAAMLKDLFSPPIHRYSSYLLSTLTDSSFTTMEKVNLGYSTKNIPLPAKNEYLKRFIEKTEHFIRRLRWKAYYFLNGSESTANESYGFKSRNSPPQISELLPFEEDMTRLIQSIKFKDTQSSFQSQLNSDI